MLADLQSKPASDCQEQQPEGYRERATCQRAAGPEEPEREIGTVITHLQIQAETKPVDKVVIWQII